MAVADRADPGHCAVDRFRIPHAAEAVLRAGRPLRRGRCGVVPPTRAGRSLRRLAAIEERALEALLDGLDLESKARVRVARAVT